MRAFNPIRPVRRCRLSRKRLGQRRRCRREARDLCRQSASIPWIETEPTLPKRRVLAVAQFPSVKAKKLLRVLQAQPLAYQVVRQKGSHRKLEAPSRPSVIFAFHDSQTIRPATVKDILCNQVGLAERDALALL